MRVTSPFAFEISDMHMNSLTFRRINLEPLYLVSLGPNLKNEVKVKGQGHDQNFDNHFKLLFL